MPEVVHSDVDAAVSFRMRQVRQRNTAPELTVRKLLSIKGYRYRTHRRDLPGSPDIVFPGRRKAIFVHGCFWHGHKNCRRASLPRTRFAYWQNRIVKNRERDLRSIAILKQANWSVLVVWECETKDPRTLETQLSHFLR